MQDKKVEKYISDQFLMHSIVAIILSYVVVHFGMKEGFFFAARFAFVIFILSYLIWQVFKKYIYRTDHWHLNAMIFHRKAAIIKNKKKKKREYDKYYSQVTVPKTFDMVLKYLAIALIHNLPILIWITIQKNPTFYEDFSLLFKNINFISLISIVTTIHVVFLLLLLRIKNPIIFGIFWVIVAIVAYVRIMVKDNPEIYEFVNFLFMILTFYVMAVSALFVIEQNIGKEKKVSHQKLWERLKSICSLGIYDAIKLMKEDDNEQSAKRS